MLRIVMPEKSLTEKDVALFWDRNAEQWSRHLRSGQDIVREAFNQPAFFEFAGDLSGLRVLDAGCGDGFATRLLAQQGADVVGIDVSAEMIRLARLEEEAAPLNIRYEVGSYTDLTRFEPGSFDRVIAFMALMDGPNLETAFAQFFTVLRPGGEFVFCINHPCFFSPETHWRREPGGWTLQVSRYFERRAQTEKRSFRDRASGRAWLQMPRFVRTLSDYLNALCDSGFVLAAMSEPRPSDEACERNPMLRGWQRHAAMFLHVRASKPRR